MHDTATPAPPVAVETQTHFRTVLDGINFRTVLDGIPVEREPVPAAVTG